MKYFFALIFIYSSTLSAEVTAPDDWWSESHVDSKNMVGQQEKVISNVLDEVFSVQNEVLSESKSKNSHFKLSEYSSGFSVSKTGLFGLSALKATQAIEVFWKKNKTSETELKVKELELTYSQNSKIRSSQIDLILDVVKKSSSVLDIFMFSTNLRKYLGDINYMFANIYGNKWKNWRFDGLRSDLFISSDGSISPVASIGAALRVRIEWKWDPTEEDQTVTNLSSLITNLLNDLDYVLNENVYEQFDLSKAYVGIGYSSGLEFFGLATAGYSLMAYARFVKIDDKNIVLDESITGDSYQVAEPTNNKGLFNYLKIKRNKWRSGLRKAIKMSSLFLVAASSAYENWSIYKVQTTFKMGHRGWLGFSSISTKAALQLVFKRKDLGVNSLYVLENRNELFKQNWTMDTVRVRGRLPVSITIPFLANGKVFPELELYWRR